MLPASGFLQHFYRIRLQKRKIYLFFSRTIRVLLHNPPLVPVELVPNSLYLGCKARPADDAATTVFLANLCGLKQTVGGCRVLDGQQWLSPFTPLLLSVAVFVPQERSTFPRRYNGVHCDLPDNYMHCSARCVRRWTIPGNSSTAALNALHPSSL